MTKDDIGGVWRTIGGRRVFIKEGQDLASAMRESGKFNNTSKKESKPGEWIEKNISKENYEKFKEDMKKTFGKNVKFADDKEEKIEKAEDYTKEKNEDERLRNVYKMDQVLRSMNNENALDDTWLMNGVADGDSDYGFEKFKENSEMINGGYFYTSDEEYNNLVNMYQRRVKKYAKDGLITDDKELVEFARKDVDSFPVYNDIHDNEVYDSKDGKKYDSMRAYKNAKERDNNWLKNQGHDIELVEDRLKNNMIVSHYGNQVAYRDKDNNLIVTGRENYNDYVNGKKDRLGGEFVTNDNDALKTMIGYEGLDKYPYEGETRDEKTGNGKKWKEFVDTEYNRLKDKVIDTTNAREERAKTNENYRDNSTKEKTRNTSGRQEIKNASPSQIEKGDLIGPKHLLVTAIRPASVEKDGYSSGYSITTKDSNGNTSRQIVSDNARNTIYKKQTTSNYMNDNIRNAYNDYKKKHPNSKMTFNDFKNK